MHTHTHTQNYISEDALHWAGANSHFSSKEQKELRARIPYLKSEPALFPLTVLRCTDYFFFLCESASHLTLGLCRGEKHRIGSRGPWALEPPLLL